MYKSFFIKIVILILLILPVAYSGIILSTTAHEVLGHGLVANLTGNTFTKFEIFPNGIGFAYWEYASDFVPMDEVKILLAGLIVNAILAVTFFMFAFIFRSKLLPALVFLVWGFINVLAGLSYMFWNAIYPIGGSGDIGQVLVHIPQYKSLFLYASGILSLLGIIIFNIFIYSLLQKWINATTKLRWVLLSTIFLIQGLAWFSADMNLLVPGVEWKPQIFALLVTVITLLIIGVSNKQPKEIIEFKKPWFWSVLFWLLAGLLVYIIIAFLQQGSVLPI